MYSAYPMKIVALNTWHQPPPPPRPYQQPTHHPAPAPEPMRTPVHPNHKRAHTHAAPNHTLTAGRRHLGWWIGGVLRKRHPEIKTGRNPGYAGGSDVRMRRAIGCLQTWLLNATAWQSLLMTDKSVYSSAFLACEPRSLRLTELIVILLS